jgi:hypothetical protein
MWPYKLKYEEKSKHASLAQQMGFGPAFFNTFCWGRWSAHQSWTPAVDWLDSLIDPGGLEFVVSPPVCSPSFSFMGGAGKK